MEQQDKVVQNEVGELKKEELTQVEKLNQMRKVYRNADLAWKCITVLVIVLAFIFIYLVYMKLMFIEGPIRVILSIIFLIAIPFCLYILPMTLKMSTKFKAYNMEYKTNFLQEKIQKEFPKTDYTAKNRISIKEISECSMIKKARSANANDCISGIYKGIDFLRYDMELSYKKSRKVSDCVLIACNNKTDLDSEIQIVQKSFNIGKNAYEKPETYLEYVTGEESFDKKFAVYVQNQEEAASFINRELMKKLLKFSGGGPFAAYFDKKKVYLIIRRKKDSMEAPIYKAVKESVCRREAEKEVEVIKKWIQLLDDCVVS